MSSRCKWLIAQLMELLLHCCSSVLSIIHLGLTDFMGFMAELRHCTARRQELPSSQVPRPRGRHPRLHDRRRVYPGERVGRRSGRRRVRRRLRRRREPASSQGGVTLQQPVLAHCKFTRSLTGPRPRKRSDRKGRRHCKPQRGFVIN